jgi:hypothetical protein
MYRKLFCFICLVLFSTYAEAITFEQYIVDHESSEMRSYLRGYADAIHNNAYVMGGCPRRLPYRPYGEYFQHIDIYITKKTKDESLDLDKFYQGSVEPLLTAVILKYIDCNNPESRHLQDESKVVQLELRNIGRKVLKETKKYQTPQEREKDFAYHKHIDRLNNPKKYTKRCPVCRKAKKCPQKQSCPKVKSCIAKQTVQPQTLLNNTQVSVAKEVVPPRKQEGHWYSHLPLINHEDKPSKKKIPSKVDVINKPIVDKKAISSKIVKIKESDVTEDTIVDISEDDILKADHAKLLQDEIDKKATHSYVMQAKMQKVTESDVTKNIIQSHPITKEDLMSVEDIAIPTSKHKSTIKESDIGDVKIKKYELESLDINLDNISDITLPSL